MIDSSVYKNNTQVIIVGIAIGLLAVISTIYLLMIGWFNLPSLDDYGYIRQTEQGFFESISLAYFGWQGRFSTFFMNGIIYLLFGRMQNLIVVTIIMLLIGYYLTQLLLKGIFDKYKLQLAGYYRWLISILIINVGAMAYLEPSTFFWLCALNYTFSTWMAILLVYALYFSQRNPIVRWIEIIFSSLYISGTAENFTPMVILVIGLLWLVMVIKDSRKFNATTAITAHKYEFVALAIMSVGFLIMLFAPGNSVRLQNQNQSAELINRFELLPFISNTIKASVILILRLASRSLYYIALIPLFFFIGTQLQRSDIPTGKITIKHTVFVLIGLLCFIVIDVAACVFGTGWYAPLRSYSFMSYAIIAVEAYLCIRWGREVCNKNKMSVINVINISSCISSLILTAFIISFIYLDVPMVKKYHLETSNRNNIINEAVKEGRTEQLVVQLYAVKWHPNTYSMMRQYCSKLLGRSSDFYEPAIILMPSDIETFPNDWKNEGIKRYYNANFDIVSAN